MNNIVTIPQKLASMGDLALVPKQEFEEFSKWKKAVRVELDEQWFWTPEWQHKEKEADEAIRAGKISGPFRDHKTLISALKSKKK